MGWTREYAFLRFQDAVRHVWRNADFVLPHIDLSQEQPAGGHQAAVSSTGRQRQAAIGDSILRRRDHYWLHVSPEFLEKTDDFIWGVLVHEAVHLGISPHNADFRRLVLEKGGVLAANEAESGGVIQVQKKVGARFQTVREFLKGQEAEATAWGREQARLAYLAGDRARWRLQFGDVMEDA